MEEIELTNNDSFVKTDFDKSDFHLVDTPLCNLLEGYYNSNNIEDRDKILEELKETHKIIYHAFHRMRRAHRDRKKYWAKPLKKDVLLGMIKEGENKYPDAKCRFIQFAFNDNNNAFFDIEAVGKFSFDSGLSCYDEVLLKYIIDTYDEIYVVKGLNHLTRDDANPVRRLGHTYNGKYNIAMLKCKLKLPAGSSEKKSFHYYDVVHDPGGNC